MSSARTADELQRLKADLASSQRRHTSLLRETSELKEQLRVESKRRETAAKKCSESQTALRDCEREIKELQFTNKKITQQLQKTSEQAQDQATRSRAIIETLKDGLARMEDTATARARDSYEALLRVYGVTQALQAHTLRHLPPSLPGAPLSAHQMFGDLMQELAALSGIIAGGSGAGGNGVVEPQGPAVPRSMTLPPVPAAPYSPIPTASPGDLNLSDTEPIDILTRERHSVAAPTSTAAAAVFAPQAAAWERERERLLHVVGRLQSEVRELRAERTANYNHEANQSAVNRLLDEYRAAVAKYRAQAGANAEQLEIVETESSALKEELEVTRRALRSREDVLCSKHSRDLAALQAELHSTRATAVEQRRTIERLKGMVEGQRFEMRQALDIVQGPSDTCVPTYSDSLGLASGCTCGLEGTTCCAGCCGAAPSVGLDASPYRSYEFGAAVSPNRRSRSPARAAAAAAGPSSSYRAGSGAGGPVRGSRDREAYASSPNARGRAAMDADAGAARTLDHVKGEMDALDAEIRALERSLTVATSKVRAIN